MEAGECLFLCVMFCWCRMRTWCTNRNTLRETAYIEPKESERERERERERSSICASTGRRARYVTVDTSDSFRMRHLGFARDPRNTEAS